MAGLGDFIGSLQDFGVYDFFLPFLLVFAIIFAILEKINIFSKDEKDSKSNIHMIIALIFALIVVVQTEIVEVINTYLSKMALFMIIVLVFLIAVGIFGGEGKVTKSASGIMLVLAIIAVIWALSPTIGLDLPNWMRLREGDVNWLVGLGLFILAIWVMMRKKETGKESGWTGFSKFLQNMGEGFQGK